MQKIPNTRNVNEKPKNLVIQGCLLDFKFIILPPTFVIYFLSPNEIYFNIILYISLFYLYELNRDDHDFSTIGLPLHNAVKSKYIKSK